ncbi:MAG: ureidoglycolate lyase, partial [Thermoleophilia bacterium]
MPSSSTHAFIPLPANLFLVIVATERERQPEKVRSFSTAPGQGINLLRNTWHGVLTPLFEPRLFAVIDRIGATPNLKQHRLAAALAVSDDLLVASETTLPSTSVVAT